MRSFRTQWNFAPKLLTPANNQIQLSYPLFSWEPVPGAQQYQIQIDDTNQFAGILLADEKLYNVTTYAHPDWSSVPIAFDAYWRVRAIDASGNYTPWSETRSFRTDYTVAPDLIYPPYSFAPDTQNLPVHRAPTLAWPVFVWDTAHVWYTIGAPYTATLTTGPDYYWLMVDDEPASPRPESFHQNPYAGCCPRTLAAQPGTHFHESAERRNLLLACAGLPQRRSEWARTPVGRCAMTARFQNSPPAPSSRLPTLAMATRPSAHRLCSAGSPS